MHLLSCSLFRIQTKWTIQLTLNVSVLGTLLATVSVRCPLVTVKIMRCQSNWYRPVHRGDWRNIILSWSLCNCHRDNVEDGGTQKLLSLEIHWTFVSERLMVVWCSVSNLVCSYYLYLTLVHLRVNCYLEITQPALVHYIKVQCQCVRPLQTLQGHWCRYRHNIPAIWPVWFFHSNRPLSLIDAISC